MNLLQETIAVLAEHDKKPIDVAWCGNCKGSFSWAEFAKLADIKYYAGYGSNAIDSTLVVVGVGWWLERGEYDGSEWWEFKTQPKRQLTLVPESLLEC